MFCRPLTDHLMPADASAPLNKRTAPSSSSNSFSLRYLFRKMKFCCRQCFVFSPNLFFHAWSPNYCGVVALAVFFLSCCCSSFEVLHIIIVVERRWQWRWCECWCCRLPDCHPLLLYKAQKRARCSPLASASERNRCKGHLKLRARGLYSHMTFADWKGWGGGHQSVRVRSIIREVAWIFWQGSGGNMWR